MFPDDFSWPTTGAGDEPDVFNVFQDEWNNVNYNVDQFAVLEDAGCVFLPAAGARYGGNTRYVFYDGNYWSSSSKDDSSAYTLYFTNDVSTATYSWRYYGHSVRLVCDVK